MHLDFNPKDKYFLHDFADDEDLRFTYNFHKDLRVTINPHSQENPFVQVIEQKDINLVDFDVNENFNREFDRKLKSFRMEPEPEINDEDFERDDLEVKRSESSLDEFSERPKIQRPIGEVLLSEEKQLKTDKLMSQINLEPIESFGSQEQSNKQMPFSVSDDVLRLKGQKQEYIDISEEKMRDFVMDQLNRFDCRTEYDDEFLNTEYSVRKPTEFDIVDYCKYVTIACKMEHEIPIIALVYIERLLLKTGILLNRFNWQRVLLVCLCLASKVWDDDSLENQHFPKVMPNVTLLEINRLEQAYLDFVDYQLVISGGTYAKYYFIMRTLADSIVLDSGKQLTDFENEKRNKKSRKEEWGQFPLQSVIKADRMLEFQKNIARAEVYLKERHERSFIDAFRDSQLAKYKKQKVSLDQTI